MLDHLQSERRSTGGVQGRLRMYMAGLLVLVAVVVVVAKWPAKEGSETLPRAPEDPVAPAEATRIDPARLPGRDDAGVHAGYQPEGLAYLLDQAQRNWVEDARTLTTGALASLPATEARGGVFETKGRVTELSREEWGSGSERLWSVVLEGEDGARLVVVKHAFASDPQEGRPEDAFSGSAEWIAVGDVVLARGIFLQRRTGTVGQALFREPVPVLVGTPPTSAFRKVLDEVEPIADPREAAWEDVEDRFLGDSQRWEEPALFQMLQWAKTRGHAQILDDIREGRLEAEPWTQGSFLAWSDEVEDETGEAPRPFTDAARGRLFRTRGLLANFVYDGWESVPREGSRWGVNSLYTFDVQSDHYGNAVIRTITPFPLATFEGVTGEVGQHVEIFGFFLKNYTYHTRKVAAEGGRGLITLPMFIVVHAEPVRVDTSGYQHLIWIISGVILVLMILFALLIRGERKDMKRMDVYRTRLRRRVREHEAQSSADAEDDPGS